MADRRRRRQKIANSDSECSEDEHVIAARREQKLSEGQKSTTSNDGSDEDSATEDNEDETEEETETEGEYEEGGEGEGKTVKGERQSGDGQEQTESLDDDEDRQNPAYIPRRGAFYEHDTRISDDVDPKEDPRAQKKLWSDKGKWGHDKFVDTFQAPKTAEELIVEYGYDIRAYDTPPDAPPKSYGRGWRDRNRSNKLGDFIDTGAGGDGYHNNEDGFPPRRRGGRGRGYGGDDGGRHSYSQIRDGGDGRNYEEKQFNNRPDYDRPRRGGYQDNRQDYDRPRRGGYQGDRQEHNRGGFHDNRSERNRDDRPERNRGGGNRFGSGLDRFADRGDGDKFNARPGVSVNAGGRGNQGNDGPEAPREAPPRDNRQWTNSNARGGALRRCGFGVPRGGARPPPQPQNFDEQSSEYPPITTAPDSREQRRNLDRPAADVTSTNVITQTQDVRHSTVGRDTYAHGKPPGEQRIETDNRPRQKRVGVPPSIVPPTTVASTTWSHAGEKRGGTDSTVQHPKHDPALAPSGGTAQNRPKRYSSQRQRTAPEVVAYQEPVVADTHPPPAPVQVPMAPRGITSPPRPQRRAAPQAYFQPVYATQPPTVFHPRADQSPPHNVASFPRPLPPPMIAYALPGPTPMQSPPQLYTAVPTVMAAPPPPASMAPPPAQPTPIVAPQYIAATPILNYVQPGQPAPYQIAAGPPPAPMPFPAPQQPQPQQQQETIHMRGGTTYFNPQVQQQLINARAPVRRVNVAIPIVNPQEVPGQGLYIQTADGLQPAYAPTYYQLAEYEQEYDQEGEPLEYEEFEDAIEDDATEPEFYEAVEAAPVSVDNRGDSRDTDKSRKPLNRNSTDGDSSKNVESESIATPVTGVNVRTENNEVDRYVKVDDNVVNEDSEETGVDTEEEDVTLSEDSGREEGELSESDSETDSVCAGEVGVASEEVGRESCEDHTITDREVVEFKAENIPEEFHETCEDHTASSEVVKEVVEAENSPQESHESGNTKPEIDTDSVIVDHVTSSDRKVVKAENNPQESHENANIEPESDTNPAVADHAASSEQNVETEPSTGEELDNADPNEGEISSVDAVVDVSTGIAGGIEDKQLGEIKDEPASTTEASIKGEIKSNEVDDREVLQVKEGATSPVDAEEDGAADSHIVKEEIKEADSGSADVQTDPA